MRTIPPGEVVRLTEAEVLSHPGYRGFGLPAQPHPPIRGWFATSVYGDDGRVYGLLQLCDKERWARLAVHARRPRRSVRARSVTMNCA